MITYQIEVILFDLALNLLSNAFIDFDPFQLPNISLHHLDYEIIQREIEIVNRNLNSDQRDLRLPVVLHLYPHSEVV